MKFAVIIVSVLFLVNAQVPQPTAQGWADQVSRYTSECICATNVDQGVVTKWLFQYYFPQDPCLKCFMKCIGDRMGINNPDGSINAEVNYAISKYVPGRTIEILDKCTNETANINDLCDKAFKTSLCIQSAYVRNV